MDKQSYEFGRNLAANLLQNGVRGLNFDDFVAGMRDYMMGAKEEGEKFLAENAKKPGVVVLPSGLQYKVLVDGKGRKPSATSKVKCHYEGTLPSGEIFDSSYKRNSPAVFGLNQVIKGWTEGLQLMGEGAKYELYIPYQLAYGETGSQGAIPPCCALKFVVELIKVLS